MLNLKVTVNERDIDMLVIDELCVSKDFANIFFQEIGVETFELLGIQRSLHEKNDVNYKNDTHGETDIFVEYFNPEIGKNVH